MAENDLAKDITQSYAVRLKVQPILSYLVVDLNRVKKPDKKLIRQS